MTPAEPKKAKAEKPKPIYTGPTLPCEHCGTVFGKRSNDSYADFQRRKYCCKDCELTAKEIIRTARQDAIKEMLPATIDEMMAGTRMTYAEVERIIRLMAIDRKMVSKPDGRNPRIYRRVV